MSCMLLHFRLVTLSLFFSQEKSKAKGVEHLIAVENPNRAGGKRNKKVSELGDGPTTTNLSRRER